MENISFFLAFCLLVVVIQFAGVLGHGRMYDPPSRSTAWRVGFKTPHDTNDMEAFCGGFERQWHVNEGRCGICGDAYDEPIKPHEAPGGIFATGTIVRNYTPGATISLTIEITAVHRGYYQFKLCPNNNPKQDPQQECFEKYTLRFKDGSDRTYVNDLTSGMYTIEVQLPANVQCTQCILQWSYVTGNRWGVCENGTGMLGCGPQEMFRACADIAISGAGGAAPVPTTNGSPSKPATKPATTARPTTTTTHKTTTTTTTRPTHPHTTVTTTTHRTTTAAEEKTPPTHKPTTPTTGAGPAAGPVAPGACKTYKAIGSFASVTGSNDWCQSLCSKKYCPETHCGCAT